MRKTDNVITYIVSIIVIYVFIGLILAIWLELVFNVSNIFTYLVGWLLFWPVLIIVIAVHQSIRFIKNIKGK